MQVEEKKYLSLRVSTEKHTLEIQTNLGAETSDSFILIINPREGRGSYTAILSQSELLVLSEMVTTLFA